MIVVYEQCMSYLIHRSSINIASPLSRFPAPGVTVTHHSTALQLYDISTAVGIQPKKLNKNQHK